MTFLDLSRVGDSGNLAGDIRDLATVSSDARVVTAVVTTDGTLKLINWEIAPDGSYRRVGDSANLGGPASDIDIALFSKFVVACRGGDGRLRLSSWEVSTGGPITPIKNSGNQAGEATRIRIISLGDNRFVTACRSGAGSLLLITWMLNADGSFRRLKDSGSQAGAVSAIDMIEVARSGTSRRVVTAVRDGSGNLRLILWSIATDGSLSRVAHAVAGTATLIRAVKDRFGNVVTAVRSGSDHLLLISWKVDATSISRLRDSANQAGGIGDNALLALDDGLVSAVRTTSGDLRLIAWETTTSGQITRRGDSGSQAGNARLISIVRAPALTERPTIVTAVQTAAGTLRLINWGPTCLGIHAKVLVTPDIAINTMVANMRTVYATAGVRIEVLSTENLNLPMLVDLDVGACAGAVTTEQTDLFGNRNNVGANEIVVYFIRSTTPDALNGCASHPAGRPGAVVTRVASPWTLAHEVGHVLGLSHCDTDDDCLLDRLMTGCGTDNITNAPPDLVLAEVNTMRSTALARACRRR